MPRVSSEGTPLTSKTFRSDSSRRSTNRFTFDMAFCNSIRESRRVELASQFSLGGSSSIGIYSFSDMLLLCLLALRFYEPTPRAMVWWCHAAVMVVMSERSEERTPW